MFNGLIRETAKIKSFSNNKLRVIAKYKPQIGDSIAINGVCLTATKIYPDGFEVELSPETQKIVPLENYQAGKYVHIEPALRFGDRIDGHLIQGHVDAIGEILEIKKTQNSYDVIIKTDPKIMKYIAPKGSIAIDGVSLTINEVFSDRFRLTIIPHTFENTLFKYYKIHQKVNIETDMFARYIYHMLKKSPEDINEKILAWW
ncbi:riboflavin synthase [Caminibacter pacificus]|uniref:Riboflavin synthase n=1 Tax=Caminibacter pacificus TaxID=1424653 RepID=A0AAJ4UXA7_9BACT|nr:riboflavin synthase [Caminibacter pacificus]NPA88336.1 riboflavin synthase [Campylobacterota bacterium]QCI27435.1 riboflavin synthase [Caminibacter pacificus]ROR38872.1 riboflavin synthase alpha chain [Caminibacter pacificus]